MSSYRAYQLLDELGKGSYGSVTKNRHILTGDVVAIKCFVTDSKDFASVKKSVLMESMALRELRYENLVRLLHVFMENSTFYMVFEFVDKTLLNVIREAPKKLLGCGSRTKSFCFQLLRALAFIHSRNYVHRDVKPENILITHSNVLKLADFGFAIKNTHAGQRYSTYIATRWYRAPELLTGDFFYGRGIDTWAAGAVIVEMILGQPMAAGTDNSDQIAKTIELLGDLPKCMRDRLLHIGQHKYNLSKVPARRFAGLETLLHGQPELYISLIKSCLEVDPQIRAPADALLLHPLFSYDNRQYISNLTAEIRQNLIANNRNAANDYQYFLKKRDLYQKAARELLHNPTGLLSSAILSRYRQLGLDEHVLRQMADMVSRDRKYPPDFLTQSPELHQMRTIDARGDNTQESKLFQRVERNGIRNQPKLGMYFQLGLTKPRLVKGDQSVPPRNVGWKHLEVQTVTPRQPENPWNNFSVQKTFPGKHVAPTPQKTTKLHAMNLSKRRSLKELNLG